MKEVARVSDAEAYDVVVVGGGHKGLTAAGYLSRAGLRVKVLERRSIVGVAAVTEEFHPGFRNSMCSYTVSLLSPKVIKDLELSKFGLQITDRATASLILGENGAFLNKHEDEAAYLAKIAETHPGDAERYHEI